MRNCFSAVLLTILAVTFSDCAWGRAFQDQTQKPATSAQSPNTGTGQVSQQGGQPSQNGQPPSGQAAPAWRLLTSAHLMRAFEHCPAGRRPARPVRGARVGERCG